MPYRPTGLQVAVYCQAISLPPPANIADPIVPAGRARSIAGYAATATGSGASKLCPVRITAQAMRASLATSATTTTLTWARGSQPTQPFAECGIGPAEPGHGGARAV